MSDPVDITEILRGNPFAVKPQHYIMSAAVIDRLRADLSESRRLLESSEAALQEAQRALFRWLPNRIGSEYDDLIAADAMTLMGLGSVDGLREIGGEILTELVEKRRLLDEANVDRDRLYKALEYVVRDLNTRANMKLRKEDRGVVDIGNGAWFQANDALEKHKAAPVPAQPAVCDDCGALCTPANNAKSHIKRCAACQSAFVASLDSAITAQPAAVPEAVAKDCAGCSAGMPFFLGSHYDSNGYRIMACTSPTEDAILSAADSRSPDKCQCNAEGEVTDACKDCPR